ERLDYAGDHDGPDRTRRRGRSGVVARLQHLAHILLNQLDLAPDMPARRCRGVFGDNEGVSVTKVVLRTASRDDRKRRSRLSMTLAVVALSAGLSVATAAPAPSPSDAHVIDVAASRGHFEPPVI